MSSAILIIDDSLTVRMDLSEIFEQNGFEVSTAADLQSAREQLACPKFSLVLLDVKLPDGDGVEFLRELRSRGETAEIPVVLLATQAEVAQRLEEAHVAADSYVGKPYGHEQLLTVAQELLQKSSSEHRPSSVLVVDDSLTYRERLSEALQGSGYSVLSAATGEEALRLASTHHPTAIVVDYMLPGINGTAVVRRIRQDAFLRRTPTLLLTASEDPRDELNALESGADTFVRKDQDFDVILACLNAIVRSSNTPSALERVPSAERVMVIAVSPGEGGEALKQQLEGEGLADVVLVERDAFAAVSLFRPDCILIDGTQDLPGAHLLTTAIKKTAGSDSQIPVLVVGSVDDRTAMISTINAGADDFLNINVGRTVLAARVRAHLRRKKLEDENRDVREHILRNQLAAQAQQELARATDAKNKELRRLAQMAEFKAREAEDSRRDFQQLAEAIPAFVWATDAHGGLTYVNQRYYAYTGLAPEQTIGFPWFQSLHPNDVERTRAIFHAASHDIHDVQIEYRVRRSDGAYRWFLARAVPVRDSGNSVSRWFGTSTDIHDRKIAEDALRRSEKIAATGRLAAAIAHEINNPLEAVVNLLYLLEVSMKDTTNDSALEYIRMAQTEIGRVSHITKQTLAFYRDADKAESIDLSVLVSEVIEVYRNKARSAGVRLEAELRSEKTIMGFAGEIRQVISNLVTNAIDASKRGLVRVRTSDVTGGSSNDASGVRLTVADNGSGVSRSVLPQLFKPFVTTKGQKGTGLGLWVSRSIVEKHQGRIRLRTSTRAGGSGTCFSIFFPSTAQVQSNRSDEVAQLFSDVARDLLTGHGEGRSQFD